MPAPNARRRTLLSLEVGAKSTKAASGGRCALTSMVDSEVGSIEALPGCLRLAVLSSSISILLYVCCGLSCESDLPRFSRKNGKEVTIAVAGWRKKVSRLCPGLPYTLKRHAPFLFSSVFAPPFLPIRHVVHALLEGHEEAKTAGLSQKNPVEQVRMKRNRQQQWYELRMYDHAF